MYFVGKGLALSQNPSLLPELQQMIRSGTVSWEIVVWASSNQMVLTVLYNQFKKNNLLAELPDDLLEYMEDINNQNLLRNQAILIQVKDIIKCLNQNNIYPVFLKGTGNLLDGLYPDQADRMIGDIDFLVPEDQVIPCAEILVKDLGYELSYGLFDPAETLSWHRHHPTLINKSTVAAVEIHRQPVSTPFDKHFNFKLIDQEKKAINHYGKAYVLSDKHQVIYNMMNVQMNDNASYWGTILMRQSYDLLLLAQGLSPLKTAMEFGHYFRKLNLYLAVSTLVFGSPPSLGYQNTWRVKLHLFRIRILLNYSGLNRIQKVILYIVFRLGRYFSLLIRCLYDNNTRLYVYRRLKNSRWYFQHLSSYKLQW